jgi:drug/metabolite transporter (DMT)-like permease
MKSASPHNASNAVWIGLASALFFTMTYVLNRSMVLGGGHWAWTAALRYLLTLPLLALVLPLQGGLGQLPRELRQHPRIWLLWGGIGFGLFCICLTYAASSGPAWLIAGSFQTTVIAGLLLSPLIYRDTRRRIPLPALAMALLVLFGVLLMQLGHFHGKLDASAWFALLCVLIAAFLYPLGNRMILLHLESSGTPLNATQRVFGMTLASQPVWFLLAVYAYHEAGWPSLSQVLQAGGVALFSGVIATVLFFKATAMVRDNPTSLAAVEAMQAAEIIFSTLIGVFWLNEEWPSGIAAFGIVIVIVGIVLFSLISARAAASDTAAMRVLRSDRID